MTARRRNRKNSSSLNKTLQKLSTGYTINSAADDAAGLAISEKMRVQMSGLEQAIENSRDGCRLVQVGEGALDEVHGMLNRMMELGEQAANGTYQDLIDREAIQKEMDKLCSEVGRILDSTNFNGVNLFQGLGYDYENLEQATYIPAEILDKLYLDQDAHVMDDIRHKHQVQTDWSKLGQSARQEQAESTVSQSGNTLSAALRELKARTAPDQLNIVYAEASRIDETVHTTQTGGSASGLIGSDPDITLANGSTKKLSAILKEEIVPNAVKRILGTYPAFKNLNGSSIGIGLDYFNEGANAGAIRLASVTTGWSATGTASSSGQILSREDVMTYTLAVNLNSAAIPANASRADLDELEETIAHEMIHAFMGEALTSGMLGVKPSATSLGDKDPAYKFPDWFVEGMAQTASGPKNWLTGAGGLNLDPNSANLSSDIITAINNNKLGSGTTASQYGTGYLACMYLGSVIASGNGQPSSTVTAKEIAGGLSKLLGEMMQGTSLDDAIETLTNQAFTDTADFVSKFNGGTAKGMGQFCADLITATGGGSGGVISGNLKDTDLLPDTPDTSVGLFQVDPGSAEVRNVYPDGYSTLSGGTTSSSGAAVPSGTWGTPSAGGTGGTGSVGGSTGPVPTTPVTAGVFQISGGVKGVDWDYDETDGTLTILSGRAMTISGGSGVVITEDPANPGSTKKTAVIGQIDVKDNIGSVDLTLAGVTCTTAKVEKNNAPGQLSALPEETKSAFDLGKGNKVNLTIRDGTVNQFTSGANYAGISMHDGTSLTIDGGTGTLKAVGGLYSAGIGCSNRENGNAGGSITINGGTIIADGHYDTSNTAYCGAGIGACTNKDFGDITINGGNITAKGGFAGAGIGGANEADVGDITIHGGTIYAESQYHGAGIGGGRDNSTNGNILITGGKITAIGLQHGTGIGAGCNGSGGGGSVPHLTHNSHSGTITITGTAEVDAQGGADGAGIGASWGGVCKDIEISGGASVKATGGAQGAGIGAGYNKAEVDGSIRISTSGTVTATGGASGAGIGVGRSAYMSGSIEITGSGVITATGGENGAGIGAGADSSNVHSILIDSSGTITAQGGKNGAGIGVGANGSSTDTITVSGTGKVSATGGDNGAGIGSGYNGSKINGDIEIKGDTHVSATGGKNGAGIGSGAKQSQVGNILIDTSGVITTTSEENGTGIGSGNGSDGASSCGDIWIKKGIVSATGPDNSTGIGAGKQSTSGNITIGDKENPYGKVVVTATGGLTNNGGNIATYLDTAHQNPGLLTIYGSNTSVCPGKNTGEGLYSTTIAKDGNGKNIYAYPLRLFEGELEETLAASEGIGNLPIPKGVTDLRITITGKDGTKVNLSPDISHEPLDPSYAYIWLTGQNQIVDISFKFRNREYTTSLGLVFYPDAGVFRTPEQPTPPDAIPPTYKDGTQYDSPLRDPEDFEPSMAMHDPITVTPIRLQIGPDGGDVLFVPKFFLSTWSLDLDILDFATQESAGDSLSIVKKAANRVSDVRGSYGALQNRLEHAIANMETTHINISDSESTIRDADMAKEMLNYTKSSILTQSSQAMLAQCNQQKSNVLQLLQ